MLKQRHIALISAVAVAISLFLVACGDTTPTTTTTTPIASNGCAAGSLKASGSTALQPYVDAVAKQYQARCTGANITVQPGGSKTGLADVEAGKVDIGDSDIFANKTTQTDLVDHQVTVVIFTVVVNPKVTGVTNLTTDQIKGIYTGKITNWKDVNGNDLPITVVSRPATSGTRATFKQYVLGGLAESPAQAKALTVDSTGTVLDTVAQTDGAIGYVTLGAADGAGAKVIILKIDGQEPSLDNIKTNAYKFWNIEHMYTKGQPSGLAKAFLDYMLGNDAKTVANGLKFAAISDLTKDALDTHQS